jgi:hypothetical protein
MTAIAQLLDGRNETPIKIRWVASIWHNNVLDADCQSILAFATART